VNLFTKPIARAETETENASYGTPFLRELGLAEQLTSLVWLAGPISGLIAQPVIGKSQYFHFLALQRRKAVSVAVCLLGCRYTHIHLDGMLYYPNDHVLYRCDFRFVHFYISPTLLDLGIDCCTVSRHNHIGIRGAHRLLLGNYVLQD